MEGGWVTAQHPYQTDARKYVTKGDVRRGEYDDSKQAGVNMMDFRVGETDIWFNETFDLVKSFIAEGGYRLYPDQISLPVNVMKSAKTIIEHKWNNMGWGYCPNNIKQWNYKYKVAFALLDPASKKPVSIFVDDAADPSKWIKGTPTAYLFKPDLSQVAGGAYLWAVAIVDTSRQNQPGILLATKGNVTAEGWTIVSDVTIK